MIASKYDKIVFSFFMALLMSGIMSFAVTFFNIGIVSNIAVIWLKAWAFSFVVAFPAIITVSPIVHKLTSLVVNEGSNK